VGFVADDCEFWRCPPVPRTRSGNQENAPRCRSTAGRVRTPIRESPPPSHRGGRPAEVSPARISEGVTVHQPDRRWHVVWRLRYPCRYYLDLLAECGRRSVLLRLRGSEGSRESTEAGQTKHGDNGKAVGDSQSPPQFKMYRWSLRAHDVVLEV